MNPGLRRLYAPESVRVRAAADGTPVAVGDSAVEAVREEWVVEDRWWIPQWLRRHYFELVLADGRVVVVFHCAVSKHWYRQRA